MTVSSAFATPIMSNAADDMMEGQSGSTRISMGGGMMGSDNMMQPTAGTSGLTTATTMSALIQAGRV
jgi:hypothetical protein